MAITQKKLMGRRGIFFTFAAIVLALMVILSFKVYTGDRLKDKMETIEIRVGTMDNFIKDLENDLKNAIFISGFRGLLSLEDYMMKKGKFFNDPVEPATPSLAVAFSDVLLYGTIGSEKMGLMENNTLLNWTGKIKAEANKTGIELEFNVDSVTIGQSEPWMVDVTVQLDIAVKDKKNTASWTISNKEYTKKINITSPAGIIKFVDPLYLIKNTGIVNNTITITAVPDFSSGTNLNTHLINSYYTGHTDAPSYLMRFENNLGSSAYGIESLVNSQELMDNGLPTYSRSAVDFIYFGTGNVLDCRVRDPSYEWFRLDLGHLDFYGAGCRGG